MFDDPINTLKIGLTAIISYASQPIVLIILLAAIFFLWRALKP